MDFKYQPSHAKAASRSPGPAIRRANRQLHQQARNGVLLRFEHQKMLYQRSDRIVFEKSRRFTTEGNRARGSIRNKAAVNQRLCFWVGGDHRWRIRNGKDTCFLSDLGRVRRVIVNQSGAFITGAVPDFWRSSESRRSHVANYQSCAILGFQCLRLWPRETSSIPWPSRSSNTDISQLVSK